MKLTFTPTAGSEPVVVELPVGLVRLEVVWTAETAESLGAEMAAGDQAVHRVRTGRSELVVKATLDRL